MNKAPYRFTDPRTVTAFRPLCGESFAMERDL